MADIAFQCPLLKLGETKETRGFFECWKGRCHLILEDLTIDVKSFIGKGHEEIKE